MDRSDNYNPFVLRVRGFLWPSVFAAKPGNKDWLRQNIAGPLSPPKNDIVTFFAGCNIKNGPNSIHLTMPLKDCPIEEAYVEFQTEEDAIKALEKNNHYFGHRFIEVFRTKEYEVARAIEKNDLLVLHIRGLPVSATKDDIGQFFVGCKIKNGLSGIHLAMWGERRPSGEAYIEFETEEDATNGLRRNTQRLGSRYIEVFRKTQYEMAWANGNDNDPSVLRIRGLDWSASKNDIVEFFDGCNIKNRHNGIHFTMSMEGHLSGQAYVEFETEADSEKGLKKNNKNLGGQNIEVFRTKQHEMDWIIRRCGLEYEGFSDACVILKGLPNGCSEEEICYFFSGLEIVRNGITLLTDYKGRSTGVAYVQFASQDIAIKAFGKHKQKIEVRPIEVLKSSKKFKSRAQLLQEFRTDAWNKSTAIANTAEFSLSECIIH